jgi:hypothetical protein
LKWPIPPHIDTILDIVYKSELHMLKLFAMVLCFLHVGMNNLNPLEFVNIK